jgi:hypothetical protein
MIVQARTAGLGDLIEGRRSARNAEVDAFSLQ